MIVPSIDMQDGQTVQLIGGREKAIDAGDPRPIAARFSRVGEIAVIDLDAAIAHGTPSPNEGSIRDLAAQYPCRIGGGIRDLATATKWLDAGAAKIIIGTAATPELLRDLPRDRVIVALDAEHGEVVVKGWRERTGRRLTDRLAELRDMVDGFLVTFVEREGRMGGIDLAQTREVIAAAGSARVTIAGGVTTAAEVAELDRLGADAQVGMAIYTGRLPLAEAFAASLVSDRPDGLFPTVVADEAGTALGLAYSSRESLAAAIETGRGIYHSRKRGLWEKGGTSGDTQELLRIDVDCDRDALRFSVRQRGSGFCHEGTRTCWGNDAGLTRLARRLAVQIESAAPGSYTARLASDPSLLRSKLLEESNELLDALAASPRDSAAITHETADVIYFALTAAAAGGVSLAQIERELDRRSLRITRRPGNAKPASKFSTTRESEPAS